MSIPRHPHDPSNSVLRRAFTMFDSNKSGKIEREKVRLILNTLGYTYDDSELDRLLSAEDTEGEFLIRKIFIFSSIISRFFSAWNLLMRKISLPYILDLRLSINHFLILYSNLFYPRHNRRMNLDFILWSVYGCFCIFCVSGALDVGMSWKFDLKYQLQVAGSILSKSQQNPAHFHKIIL